MSNNTPDYDVIIAGAGPAGSTAGYILSKNGLRVLIIDRASFPRDKLCGGLLSGKTITFIQKLYGETKSSLVKKKIINFISHSYQINFKTDPLIHKNTKIPFYFSRRFDYDNFLLQNAINAGSETLLGYSVKHINFNTNTITTENNKTMTARFIIGADGVHSLTRRELVRQQKIKLSNWQTDLAMGFECSINKKFFKKNITFPIIYFGFVKWGYCWLFPNRDEYIIGMGGLNRKNKNRFKNQFHDFLSIFPFDSSHIPQYRVHPVPFGNYIEKPAYKNTFLIGDAAGQVDPILGEGIYYAHLGAEVVSRVILQIPDKSPLERNAYFYSLLNKHIYSELKFAKKLRWFLFNNSNTLLKYKNWKIIFKLFRNVPDQIIHGYRSYRFFRKQSF